MARLPRLYAPRIPQLVQVDFAHTLAGDLDPSPTMELDRLLTWLQNEARERRVATHGWVLLRDRIVLLATPPAPESLPKMMQALGRRFATQLQHGRVFAGRYRNALIEPDRWVLPSLIWLESLPVQQNYVDQAEDWPWSSAAFHIGTDISHGAWAVDHPDYWRAGNTPFARQAAYRQHLHNGLTAAQRQQVQQALFGQWALGDADFLAKLKTISNRRLAPAVRGRPKKNTFLQQ